MDKQKLEDIQIGYLAFHEHISYAHSYLEYLQRDINKFLFKYIKSKHYDKKLAEELEINLLCLESFYNIIDDIIENNESITLHKLTLPEMKNVVNLEDYISMPKDYDRDIFVNPNSPIDWTKLKKTDF